VKALICHPATMTHASIPPEARAELGLSDSLIRLSPGCENSEDLVDDLVQGLRELEIARASRRGATVAAR
jgi:cystathionine beta-lyase/cystathionine gamma-synthase